MCIDKSNAELIDEAAEHLVAQRFTAAARCTDALKERGVSHDTIIRSVSEARDDLLARQSDDVRETGSKLASHEVATTMSAV